MQPGEDAMTGLKHWAAGLLAALGGTTVVHAETLTIATVNNDDMIIMQKLSSKWEQQTGNKINWVVLEENVLRQKVTTDIATKGGSYDVITIGAYETPIWGSAHTGKSWPIGRQQAIRSALLCRKLLHDVPEGSVREGWPHHARSAHS
jgi:hypothetical protein